MFVGRGTAANHGANHGAGHRFNPWRGHDSGLRNDPVRRRYADDRYDTGRDHAVGNVTGRHHSVYDHTRDDASRDDQSCQSDHYSHHHANRYSRRVSEWPVDPDRDPVITITG